MRFRTPDASPAALTPRRSRVSGAVLAVAGLFLTALALALSAFFLGYLSLSDVFPGTYRDPEAEPIGAPVGAYVFTGFILLFGVVSLAEGIWRVCFARHNRYLLTIIMVLGGIFMAAGVIIQGLD